MKKTTPPSVKIVLVDDHRLFLESMTELLACDDSFEVVAAVTSYEELKKVLEQESIDLLLLDLDMPSNSLDGFEIIQEMRESEPHIKLLVVSMYTRTRIISKVLKLGAHGILDKNVSFFTLRLAIHSIMDQGVYLSEEQQLLLNKERHPFQLTNRELEVAQKLALGLTLKAVANDLHIEYATADNHRKSIYRKLHVNSAAAFVRKFRDMEHHTNDKLDDMATFKK